MSVEPLTICGAEVYKLTHKLQSFSRRYVFVRYTRRMKQNNPPMTQITLRPEEFSGAVRNGIGIVAPLADIVNHPDAEAIFFSCTNLHTYEVIEKLEAKYDKPVLSANQITVWACLRAGNLPMSACNQRLFTTT